MYLTKTISKYNLTSQFADGISLSVVATHQLMGLVDHIRTNGRLEDQRQINGHILASNVLV